MTKIQNPKPRAFHKDPNRKFLDNKKFPNHSPVVQQAANLYARHQEDKKQENDTATFAGNLFYTLQDKKRAEAKTEPSNLDQILSTFEGPLKDPSFNIF